MAEMPSDEAADLVKSNYRRALKWRHSDTNRNDPDADEKTKAIYKANSVLSDPIARAEYLNPPQPTGRIFRGVRK